MLKYIMQFKETVRNIPMSVNQHLNIILYIEFFMYSTCIKTQENGEDIEETPSEENILINWFKLSRPVL